MNPNPERITLDELYRLDRIQREKDNPWTPEREAAADAKSKLERERNAAWELAHPAKDEDEDDEDDPDEDDPDEDDPAEDTDN
jgi:hypothetical protein